MVSTLNKFFLGQYDLVNPYNVAVSSLISDVVCNNQTINRLSEPGLYYRRIFAKISVQIDRHGGRNLLTK